MRKAYYYNNISSFYKQSPDEVLGIIARNNEFALEKKQRNVWLYEIELLRNALRDFLDGDIAFEYTIPRIGDRIDNVIILNGVIYLIEFKVGEINYPQHAIDQVFDYALDLKYFHKESKGRKIIPILVCTKASSYPNSLLAYDDQIYAPMCTNEVNLRSTLEWLAKKLYDTPLPMSEWLESQYMPTPTIIEAAQMLYRGHNVKEISRADSGAYNLDLTTAAIDHIVDESKGNNEKSICFITGVPGAGKTLAGLNIANSRHNFDENEHAVFLSGNGPLVFVLREALTRDEFLRLDQTTRKKQIKKKTEAFIQNIHHFRNSAIGDSRPPIEKVVIFDEAQRAWTKEQTAKFMNDQGIYDWEMSEPEFLIDVMNRHNDWCVIVCLVGGGQEINTGEAGLPAWFDALRDRFPHWKVYVSQKITDEEYTQGRSASEMFSGLSYNVVDELHLAVSLRSFRSERVADFVKALLDQKIEAAQKLYKELKPNYPILMTRDLEKARTWVRKKARGSERLGLVASSGAKRLRTFGIWVQSNIVAENWFLNGKDDVRSSYALEETATEFDIQGLEIDWTIVAWDADLRIQNNMFSAYKFIGTRWNSIHKREDRMYLKNAYRVLLTRARQGLIIFIPEGDDSDMTRLREFYDGTYQYFCSIGIEEI